MKALRVVSLVLVACTFDSNCEVGSPRECEVGSIRRSGPTTFEECEDDLCGAVVLAGSARIATSWHPGEHALEIDPGGRVILLHGLFLGDRELLSVDLLGNCEPGGRLFVQGTEVTGPDDVATRRRIEITDFDAGPGADVVESGRRALFRVEGSARCWIDDVVLRHRATSCPSDDAGPDDAGPRDAGPRDAGPPDAGPPDAG